MSGYSLSLVYRKDLLDDPKEKAAFKEKYGYELQVPKTMEQMANVTTFFTRPKEDFYGLVAGGARGVCCGQEFMTYLKCFNARIFDEKGNVTLNSPESLAALKFFVRIFDEWAPPGAAAYWWDGRETAYRMGKVLMQITWSISRPGYELPDFSKIIGKAAMAAHPSIPGVKTSYGYAGYGETSLMLALHPELVTHEAIPSFDATRSQWQEDQLLQLHAPWKTEEISLSGVIGEAQKASAEFGEEIIAYFTE